MPTPSPAKKSISEKLNYEKETKDSSVDKDSENNEDGSDSDESKKLFRKRHGYFPDKKKVTKPTTVEKEKPLPELPEYPDYTSCCNICFK